MRWPPITLCLLLLGCPSEEPTESSVCGEPGRDQVYRPALEPRETEGDLTFRLLSADPAPPNVETNLWTVAISDGADGPDDPCACTVTAFMPDHGSGTTPAPTCSPGESAQFLDIEMDWIMPGLWEVTIDVDCGASQGTALYAFCAEG